MQRLLRQGACMHSIILLDMKGSIRDILSPLDIAQDAMTGPPVRGHVRGPLIEKVGTGFAPESWGL